MFIGEVVRVVMVYLLRLFVMVIWVFVVLSLFSCVWILVVMMGRFLEFRCMLFRLVLVMWIVVFILVWML